MHDRIALHGRQILVLTTVGSIIASRRPSRCVSGPGSIRERLNRTAMVSRRVNGGARPSRLGMVRATEGCTRPMLQTSGPQLKEPDTLPAFSELPPTFGQVTVAVQPPVRERAGVDRTGKTESHAHRSICRQPSILHPSFGILPLVQTTGGAAVHWAFGPACSKWSQCCSELTV